MEASNLLTPEAFFFDVPLYTKIEITSENKVAFINLAGLSYQVDGYHPILKENTTFIVNNNTTNRSGSLALWSRFFTISLRCVRTNTVFSIYVALIAKDNGPEEKDEGEPTYNFFKVGQYPSIADFHIAKVKEYDKVLDKKYMREFTRAIGIAANGVGIGSFVYLRRIFEMLIEEAHQLATTATGWNESEYQTSRMTEKIKALSHHLPVFLVENSSIYGILSKGIHELEEGECRRYFEPLKLGIELILEEKVEAQKKKERIAEAQRKIQLINQQIKK